MTKNTFLPVLFFTFICASHQLLAQFEFVGQLLQRAEFRNGYGKLIKETTDPAAFIGQRLRLQGNYKFDRANFYLSVQDIRTWGNTSQIKVSDGLFSVHEAYANINLDSAWSVKLGRQELNYDNARFLGNLDWALQARAHDFALLKYEKKAAKIHIGLGFNQDGEALTGNIFYTANQYKTAQMLRYENKFNNFEGAFLFWNNGKQYVKKDSVGNVTEKTVRYTQTLGLPTLKYQIKNTTVSGFVYYQMGKDVSNKKVSAYDVSVQVSHNFKFNEDKKNQLKLTLGMEMISGTNSNNTNNENHSFLPMYGTNHAHNGYMDYFFVGGRNENSVGLNDVFLRAKYDFNPKAFISFNTHYFSTNADFYVGNEKQKKDLGTEFDVTGGYIFSKNLSLQAGYSHLLPTTVMQKMQNQTSSKSIQNWAYLMLVIRPNSDKKFVGLLY